MKSNELRKGDKVILRDTGWRATLTDNARGNIRQMDVEGLYRETGSVYVWDIAMVTQMGGRPVMENVELTPKQAQTRSYLERHGYI